ncbi:MAG: hypothetical protein CVU44_17370 [Chloroflexi bacterium HGW-Chloroflexi-6]|nr:MAG: hypothetical protein CVU44_17370 [Chloroflexi bacterium HGW-Chloroflexi-6]
MTTMKQFRWFWAWDDEKEETWLREMAQKGWHFQSVTLPGNYTFEQGEPRDDVYRLDHFVDNKNSKADYLQLFMDAGWDYMGEMNGWQYFRKTAVNGVIPEIFTDNESKAKKYQRIMLYLVIFLPIYINAINLVSKRTSTLSEVFTFIMLLFMLLYSYGIIRLIMRVNQLKKKI